MPQHSYFIRCMFVDYIVKSCFKSILYCIVFKVFQFSSDEILKFLVSKILEDLKTFFRGVLLEIPDFITKIKL